MYIGQVKIGSEEQLEEFLKTADVMCIGTEIYNCGGFTFKVPNNTSILATLRRIVIERYEGITSLESYGYG